MFPRLRRQKFSVSTGEVVCECNLTKRDVLMHFKLMENNNEQRERERKDELWKLLSFVKRFFSAIKRL
jgi:hypothetical protein